MQENTRKTGMKLGVVATTAICSLHSSLMLKGFLITSNEQGIF